MRYAIAGALVPTAVFVSWAAIHILNDQTDSSAWFRFPKSSIILVCCFLVLAQDLAWLLLALPFIALVRDIRGLRFLFWLVVGSMTLPLEMVILVSWTRRPMPVFTRETMQVLCSASVASFVATLIYLVLLWRGQRKAHELGDRLDVAT
jgi:hypothetical protein